MKLLVSTEQVAKLTAVGDLAMIQMHGGDLKSVKTDDEGDVGSNQPKHRERQVKFTGHREGFHGRGEATRAPDGGVVKSSRHRLAYTKSAKLPRQRVGRESGFLDQNQVGSMSLHETAEIVDPGSIPP